MAKHDLKYTDEILKTTDLLKDSGLSWNQIAAEISGRYAIPANPKGLREAYSIWRDAPSLPEDDHLIRILKSRRVIQRTGAANARENRFLLDYMSAKDDLYDQLRTIIETLPTKAPAYKPSKPGPDKRPLTLELMVSDLHFGKKTDTFNLEIARSRMRQFTHAALGEIERNNKIYNVERLIVALIGDMTESYTMHGLESARGCEFGNARQVVEAIRSLYEDLLLPLAQTGLPIDVPAVTGNHDRTERDKTYNNPGEENLSYIIYRALEMLCDQAGLKNVRFLIPVNPYQTLDIYGNTACYEHFDNARTNTGPALGELLNARTAQTKKVIDFFRGGHFHELTIYGRGRIIVNGSLPGPDSYGDVKGYSTSHSELCINYYIPSDERPTCYFRSFPVYLK